METTSADLRARIVERLKAGKLDLPLLPRVASQVVLLAGDPRADAGRLSSLIHQDPSLAGHVLKIANSPGYLPSMPIVSLQQAVARLGLAAITEIAFVASLRSGTFRVPGYEADLGELWWLAIASGAFAKEIARLKRANVESAFLCGLLHAIGKPALLQLVADVEQELSETLDAKGLLRQVMPAVLAEYHVAIGVKLAELWRLPAQVASAIAYHERYDAAPEHKLEAMITQLADRFATQLVRPDLLDVGALRALPVVAALNLYDRDVDVLVAKRDDIARRVAAMGS